MKKSIKIVHPLKPLINKNSKILILGSFPSVKSRELSFFYMHPQNRFWKILTNLFEDDFYNASIDKKIDLCHKHNIAIYDTIYSCEIIGSSDASIENVVPNKISELIKNTKVSHIFCNGNTSYKLFIKYNKDIDVPVSLLPSTSPANARMSFDDLLEKWSIIKKIWYFETIIVKLIYKHNKGGYNYA